MVNQEEISDEELIALMQAINNRYGLDFTNYERSSLKRGIVRLMMKNKMETIIELWSRVLKDEHFFKDSIDDLLVNLTELFRNPDVWIKLRDHVIPTLGNDRLSVWHAGCSTGEEAYTMSFLLETINRHYQANLLATDLSGTALRKARKGEYNLQVMQSYLKPFLEFFPGKKLSDYFDYTDKSAVIKSQYLRNITFQKHNLVADAMHGAFDIIFCRNVMIYFDDLLKEKVLKLLYDNLKPNGYFVIGYYDIMPSFGKELFKTYDIKTKIYVKKS
ncbi:MAG: protein-glutamate O-methyltransferase CheR [Bacteroidota bacterium]